jgi:GTP-binding protein YchF
MKVGIVGLPQSGKSTLFQILTGTERPATADSSKVIVGIADIIDPRFEILVDMYEPKKIAHAKIDLALLPKMEKENISRGDIFRDIADMDAICHVVRAFEDDSVYHVDGSVDPIRDLEMVNAELVIHDLIFVEKRIESLEIKIKKIKDEKSQKELVLLKKLQEHLEQEKPLRLLDISAEEEPMIRSYPFITRKQMIIVLNISEDDLGSTGILDKLKDMCEKESITAMQVSAQVESEIALLDSEDEKTEFMNDLGITEPALGKITRLCLDALGLISFFTVGTDEVRQWLMRKNYTAPFAAGVIHSDLQKGFIRAETMKYDELIEHKSEAELKKAGKIYLNGKDYVVEDGDLLNIRFNV